MKKAVRLLFWHLLFAGVFGLPALTVGCPLRTWLGISCPGCGMTRAYLSLLKGDILSAFHYHPLFWLFPPYLFLYLHRRPFRLPGKERLWNLLLLLICLLMITVYLLRLFGGSEIVVFDPSSGLLWQFILPQP